MSATTLPDIALAHRAPITVAMYHQMIDSGVLTEHDHVELIEEVIVAVSPQSPEHVHAYTTLLDILYGALGKEWRIRASTPLTLARSEPEPDIVRGLGRPTSKRPTT
jgi:hypothetical protein